MDGAAARRARRPIAHCGQGRGCAGERPQGRPPEEVGQRLTESPVRPRGPWDAPPLSPLSDPPNNIGPACQGGAVDSGSEDKGPLSRSEEHTSELQSLMRISYAVFCLKKKKNTH